MRPKLSILIPVWNQEELVIKALDSIPRRDDIEVLAYDDGSTGLHGQDPCEPAEIPTQPPRAGLEGEIQWREHGLRVYVQQAPGGLHRRIL